MKKADREIYLVLAQEMNWSLCGFCRHSRNDGGSICYEEGDVWCEHPLEAVQELWRNGENADVGHDCWGFSPLMSVRDMADMVGIILAQDFDPNRCQWYRRDDKRIVVEGIKLPPVAIERGER